MVPFIENMVDVKGDKICGFQAIVDFLGLTEKSHIMVRRHLIIQELKDHRNDYVWVFAGEGRYNYILNSLHPPKNSGGIALVDKWLTLSDRSHIVATYYNRLVILLTNHEIRTSESFFALRGVPPLKQNPPIMCLALIPNHFVFLFLKDGCPLLPSSMEWNNHKSDETTTWEFMYLDQQARFRELMKIEKREKPPSPKKSQTKPILFCVTLQKNQRKNLKLLGKMKKILFHLMRYD